jgi:pyridoxal 5'-phosphate synthase pdxT subunit
MISSLGAEAVEVRLPGHLAGLDGLIIPGGEKHHHGQAYGSVRTPHSLRAFASDHPVLGTCASLIMLASRTTAGDQSLLAVLNVTVRRNAFGRQVRSFEAPVELRLPDEESAGSFPGVFIRAPWVEELGPASRRLRAARANRGREAGPGAGRRLSPRAYRRHQAPRLFPVTGGGAAAEGCCGSRRRGYLPWPGSVLRGGDYCIERILKVRMVSVIAGRSSAPEGAKV